MTSLHPTALGVAVAVLASHVDRAKGRAAKALTMNGSATARSLAEHVST
jgi:hypothetical protein